MSSSPFPVPYSPFALSEFAPLEFSSEKLFMKQAEEIIDALCNKGRI